ncbi:MAG: L-seryl-tRNA(Ser) seleniumtransferase [Chlamydiales bacterium]|jgi:L-seryl-tRNA(Ser) seleniumtransferase
MSEPQAINPFRLLPSVDECLRLDGLRALEVETPRALLASFVESVLDGWRMELRKGTLDAAGLEARLAAGGVERAVRSEVLAERGRGLHRAVNATGVVLHTGLGRAPIHPDAVSAMTRAAAGFCTLEVDRFTGQRNRRDQRLSLLLERATGAEAGLAVNNNAAAVLLVLQTFAAGRQAVVSRGELVEIGGSFRVPDVMVSAGVELCEVGTTNRTRIADYRAAIGERTGLLMKVHTSNFKVVGFTSEATSGELAELGTECGVPTSFDLGAGLLEPLEGGLLDGETLVRDAVASGIDVVTFSGDKLLGAPQAGLIVGKRAALEKLRANPLYRALRLDKVSIAGLEATLGIYESGRADELPARRMLVLTAEELEPRAQELARAIDALAPYQADVIPGHSQPGSGSAPGVLIDTFVVRVHHDSLGADALASALRAGTPAVFARIQDGALLLDPRTLLLGEGDEVLRVMAAVGDGREA